MLNIPTHCDAENGIGPAAAGEAAPEAAAVASVSRCVQLNFTLRAAPGIEAFDAELLAELRSQYRAPHVRCIVRNRIMCQAGRARAADACSDESIVAWLCERAPLWVVAQVCQLLRDSN